MKKRGILLIVIIFLFFIISVNSQTNTYTSSSDFDSWSFTNMSLLESGNITLNYTSAQTSKNVNEANISGNAGAIAGYFSSFIPANAIDNSSTTRFIFKSNVPQTLPADFYVNFSSTKNINQLIITQVNNTANAMHNFNISFSDGSSFPYNFTNNFNAQAINFTNRSVNWIRIDVNDAYNTTEQIVTVTNGYVGIGNFQVYEYNHTINSYISEGNFTSNSINVGDYNQISKIRWSEIIPSTNSSYDLAVNKSVWTSNPNPNVGVYEPEFAVDRNSTSAFVSDVTDSYPKSWFVDLGKNHTLNRVIITPIDTASFRANKTGIFVSENNITYSQVGSNLSLLGANDVYWNFSNSNARYVEVRMYSNDSTSHYMGFEEFYVYGLPFIEVNYSLSLDNVTWSNWFSADNSTNTSVAFSKRPYIKIKGFFRGNSDITNSLKIEYFELDFSPIVNISSFINNSFYNTGILYVNSSNSIKNISVYVNGLINSNMTNVTPNNWELDVTSFLIFGKNNILIKGLDSSGNEICSDYVSFYYSDNPYQVNLTNFIVKTSPLGSLIFYDLNNNTISDGFNTLIELNDMNLAFNKTVWASEYASGYNSTYYSPNFAVDGNRSSYLNQGSWTSGNSPVYPKKFYVDLGDNYSIDKVRIYQARVSGDKLNLTGVFLSQDNITYTQIGDNETMSGMDDYAYRDFNFNSTKTRYVSVYIYSSAQMDVTNYTAIEELEVYATKYINTSDMAYSSRIIEETGNIINISFKMLNNSFVNITHKFSIDKSSEKVNFRSLLDYNQEANVSHEYFYSEWGIDNAYYVNQTFHKNLVPANEFLISKWLPQTLFLINDKNITISNYDLDKSDDIEISFNNSILTYRKYLLKNESHMFSNNYSGVGPVSTGITRSAGDNFNSSILIKFFNSSIKMPVLNHFPYLFGSGLILTEHADQGADDWGVTGWDRRETVMFGSNDSTREDYGKKGFIGHNIIYQVGVWTLGSADNDAGIYSHSKMKEIIDTLVWDYGYNMELHGNIKGRENVNLNLSLIQGEYNNKIRTWIDHGPSAFCESISTNGTKINGGCYIVDVLENNGIDYFWNSNTGTNGFPTTEDVLNYSSSLTYFSQTNSLYGFWTSIAWTKGGLRPTENDLNSLYQNKKLVIDHTYYLGGNLPNHWNLSNGVALINLTFDSVLDRMENYQNQNKLWIPDPDYAFDWLLNKQRIDIEPYEEGVYVVNHNPVYVKGLTIILDENISAVKKIEDNNYLIYVINNSIVLPRLNPGEIKQIEISYGPYNNSIPQLYYVEPHLEVIDAYFNLSNGYTFIQIENNTAFDIYNKTITLNYSALDNFYIKDNGILIGTSYNDLITFANSLYSISYSNNSVNITLPSMSHHNITLEPYNYLSSSEIINEGSSSDSGSSCIPEWNCLDWGECLNGFQERTCKNTNNCYAGEKIQTIRECIEDFKDIEKSDIPNKSKTHRDISEVSRKIIGNVGEKIVILTQSSLNILKNFFNGIYEFFKRLFFNFYVFNNIL